MILQNLPYIHLWTVVPCFFIGAYLLLNRKGTPVHKMLGRVYMPLMLFTAVATLFMDAQVGPTFLGHFGFIHFFSFLVLFSIPASFIAIRKGDIRGHRGSMIGVYIGGILIAGSLAFTPGRMLHGWLFG